MSYRSVKSSISDVNSVFFGLVPRTDHCDWKVNGGINQQHDLVAVEELFVHTPGCSVYVIVVDPLTGVRPRTHVCSVDDKKPTCLTLAHQCIEGFFRGYFPMEDGRAVVHLGSPEALVVRPTVDKILAGNVRPVITQ